MEKLVGGDKDREITHQLPSWAKENWFGETGLTYCQLNSAGKREKVKLKRPFPAAYILPRLVA